MRNLIIGTDGTWNKPDQFDRDRQVPSNVVKMVRAVQRSDSGLCQLRWYAAGVGAGGWIDKMWGGVAGRGLFGNMRQAYTWLIDNFQPDDRLFMFGFSRGAFTVRSLAGMLQLCGIPVATAEMSSSQIASQASSIYRISDPIKRAAAGTDFRERNASHPGVVHFLGVWDTVGAMGLPTKGPMGWLTRARHRFHNVQLGDNITHAYQALAINEQRAPFEPALWQQPCPPQVQTVQQMWFPGVHANVGGGYVDAGLSDVALTWMMESAASHGLVFNPEYVAQRVDPNVFGELRDSMTAAYRIPLAGRAKARAVGSGALGEALHLSVQQRWFCPSRPDDLPF